MTIFIQAVFFCCCIFVVEIAKAQNVGIGTNTPRAALDVTSTTHGFLPPRMTFAQRNAIINPEQGLMIFCRDCDSSGQPQFFNGTKWCNMLGGAASGLMPANLPSVTIGTQIWSSKNLAVRTYRNGDPIPQVTDQTAWSNLTTGAWCWYNNDSATYAAAYGRLYNWYAVNDPRGFAPQGWHVPTEADWNLLVKYLDAGADTVCQSCFQSTTAGGAMKTIAGWNSPNTGATNSSGFSGLPAGNRFRGGPFSDAGDYAYWWSASEFGTESAWLRNLYYYNGAITRYNNLKSYGYSVRVIKD